MQRVSDNGEDTSRESTESGVEAGVPKEHIAVMMWTAPLELRKKFNAIMNNRNHLVISDTLNAIIAEEFDRAGLRI